MFYSIAAIFIPKNASPQATFQNAAKIMFAKFSNISSELKYNILSLVTQITSLCFSRFFSKAKYHTL